MIKQFTFHWFCCLFFCFASSAWAVDPADLLLPEQAFQLTAKVKQADKVVLSWDIAEGYYLYRHKIKVKSQSPGIPLIEPDFPAGFVKQDKFFGDVEIYRKHLEITVPLQRQNPQLNSLVVEVAFQGCAEVGVCYMPMQQSITLDLSAADPFKWWGNTGTPDTGLPFVAEQNRIATGLKTGSVWFIISSFLGLGVLLAFTPCIFPMLPILSGIIIGQGATLTPKKAFGLSFCYVLASALTYTGFGVLAGLFGSNLQVVFQQPAAIIAFSLIYVLLALSMLGVFQLQIPAFIQTKLNALSAKHKGGSFWGAAVLGLFSALAIGPCVTAPLAGALIYIGQTGDALLGGLALFALGLGMGIPLLIIGTYSGKILPKAGAWMKSIKVFFGWGMLAVALWLLTRLLAPTVSLILWLLWVAVPILVLLGKQRWKGIGLILATYSLLLGIAVVTNQEQALQPLLCNVVVSCEGPVGLNFERITSVAALQQRLSDAQASKQWVMLDFYADWCASCTELAAYTFSDPKVIAALSKVMLIQADVTENLPAAQALLKRYNLIGPPAILFFGPDQQERKAFRVIGYIAADQFLNVIQRVFL